MTKPDQKEGAAVRIVVIGGAGLIGSRVVAGLGSLGHVALAASTRTGVDSVTGEGLAKALADADVVVDASRPRAWEDDAASLDFFMRSTQNLLAAEVVAGVEHHVVLSVVGVDRMLDSGFFRAKIVQEALVRSGPVPHTIVRSTQFFEFIDTILEHARIGDSFRVPPAFIQPIAADDVASAVARAAVGSPVNGIIEVAGPDRLRLDEVLRTALLARGDPRPVTTDPSARYFGGVRLDDETLVPDFDARIGVERLSAWLSHRSDQLKAGSQRSSSPPAK